MSSKKELRKIVFARRKEATDSEIEEKSSRLFARVTEMPAYKEAKRAYLMEKSEENWKAYCEAKRKCMFLGVII